jgi:low density lipoprotein-related protein 2
MGGNRHKRMSEPQLIDTGVIYVCTSDGRYLRRVVYGKLQVPTAVVALPQLGRICYADSGIQGKIECADMDGNLRQVIASDLIYSPTSMAVDEGRDNRIYWADPKYHKIDSCLPDGSRRMIAVNDRRVPWAIDVFENHIYWASKETQNLFVQDKFGRGRIHILGSLIPDMHSVRIQQRFARDMLKAESICAKVHSCSHLCVELPGHAFRCLCPENITQLDVIPSTLEF